MVKNLVISILIFLFLVGCRSQELKSNTNFKNIDNIESITKITINFSNMYVLKINNKYLLIDCGLPETEGQLISEIKKAGIEPSQIDFIILTHAHPDHAGNASYFKNHFGSVIIAGKSDTGIIQAFGEDNKLCPKGLLGELVNTTTAKKRYDTFEPDILISEDFSLELLGLQGRIMPFPGHTPGSLVIQIKDAVFVGDIIRGKLLNSKQPTRHLFVCNQSENLENIKSISHLQNIATWYPGHGGPLKHNDVLDFIKKETLN